jgi:hypothetical protein
VTAVTLGAAALLAAFMIAGLRLLAVDPAAADAPAQPAPAAADHALFRRPTNDDRRPGTSEIGRRSSLVTRPERRARP